MERLRRKKTVVFQRRNWRDKEIYDERTCAKFFDKGRNSFFSLLDTTLISTILSSLENPNGNIIVNRFRRLTAVLGVGGVVEKRRQQFVLQ